MFRVERSRIIVCREDEHFWQKERQKTERQKQKQQRPKQQVAERARQAFRHVDVVFRQPRANRQRRAVYFENNVFRVFGAEFNKNVVARL